MEYSTLIVEVADGVATITLNRPDRANAMEEAMWHELRAAMRWADATAQVRCVVLRGAGRHFTSGIDLAMLAGLEGRIRDEDAARAREKLRLLVLDLQDCLTSVERNRKPVLAAVHGACIGGGVDLITACDVRYCAAGARFCVREIDVGMTADVGTLQRLPGWSGRAWRANWRIRDEASRLPRRWQCAWSIGSLNPPRLCSRACTRSRARLRQSRRWRSAGPRR